jgi:N-acetylglucosamine malate deacetylase 1
VTAPAAHRHPDHLVVPALARRAIFLSRLASLETSAADARWWPQEPQTGHGGPWTPEVVADTCPVDRTPDMFFDITDSWAAKSEALSCYASQFNRAQGRRATIINDPGFLQEVEAVGRRWGRRAGVKHAEALRVDMRPVFDDLPQGRWA